MQIAFRTDASLQIGSGHVMRCLTLADALRALGGQCHFISRAHPGHLLEVIRQRGYTVHCLKAEVRHAPQAKGNIASSGSYAQPEHHPQHSHSAWLGSTWQLDAKETADVLAKQRPDWLVVDHYALDKRWEDALAPYCSKLLVIDDLADRPHHCKLLLDQNLGRRPQDYADLVSMQCQVITGPNYALLRPEFAALRPYSLLRRVAQPTLRQLLITMGGVDQPNATGQVLQALKTCALPLDCRITVVMGLTAPWLDNVRELAARMPWHTEVAVNVDNMAQRMADSDLAIGAAGSTSWERCCLGLPTLMVTLAENQKIGAHALESKRAALLVGELCDIPTRLPLAVSEIMDSSRRTLMSTLATGIADGRGVERVLIAMALVHD